MLTGIGIGIGFGGARRMTPAQLTTRLQSVLGATLVGLYVGEDLVVDGLNATSWPGRVGGTATPVVDGSYRTISALNGRKACSAPSISGKRGFYTPSITTASVFCVGVVSVLPFASFDSLYRGPTAITAAQIVGIAGSSSLYAPATVVDYIDGVQTKNCTLGAHIFESVLAAGETGAGSLGCGWDANDRTWPGPLACAVCVSAVPTPTQRAQVTAALATYYSIPLP